MNEEDLERTGMISKIMTVDEVSIEERLEQIEHRLDYNDFPIWKKNQINELMSEIRKEENSLIKDKKFEELIQLMEE